MPKSSKQELATKAKYNASPEQKAYRAELGRARYAAEKEGLVRKGDGKHIAHKVAHDNGGSAAKGSAPRCCCLQQCSQHLDCTACSDNHGLLTPRPPPAVTCRQAGGGVVC
jgi:hypothetical protein